MKKRELRINVRVSEQEKKLLKRIAQKVGVSQADIVRKAVTEEIEELTAKINQGEEVKLGWVSA